MGNLAALTRWQGTLDAFFGHHRKSIRFRYQCFDRIALNALIPPFQQPKRVIGFFGSCVQRGL